MVKKAKKHAYLVSRTKKRSSDFWMDENEK